MGDRTFPTAKVELLIELSSVVYILNCRTYSFREFYYFIYKQNACSGVFFFSLLCSLSYLY
ncbi:hypothetical protein DTL98_21015, partial [Escherichia coli]